jgi:8-oxo-dGTP pyrophosphatase MutT (NUDIX family)
VVSWRDEKVGRASAGLLNAVLSCPAWQESGFARDNSFVPSRNPWKTLTSRTAYENAWLRVREDQVLRPDGNPGIYGVVEIRPSVGILVLNDRNEVALVGQWRYTLNRYTWEIVRGGSSEGETDMLAVAKREVREEIGYEASEWLQTGSVDVCNGVTTDVQHLFTARNLVFVGTEQDPFEEIVTQWKPFDEAVEMVLSGAITEVCSVAAILRHSCAHSKLGKTWQN